MTKERINKNNCLYNIAAIKTTDKHPTTLIDTNIIKGIFIFTKDTNVLMGVQLKGLVQIAETINFFGYAIQTNATAHELYALNYASHPMGTASPNKYIAHMAATALLKKIK